MSERAGQTGSVEVHGTLRWNEFEGGFWSLELEPAHEQLGSNLVLGGFEPPAGATDGSRVRARVVPQRDTVDFLMAGPRADVLDVELI